MTRLGLPAPLLLLSFVEERKYLGRDSNRWAHLLMASPFGDVKLGRPNAIPLFICVCLLFVMFWMELGALQVFFH